jgi:hypothetical protein
MRSNDGCGITLSTATRDLLESGRTFAADILWAFEKIDADDIAEMLALNGIQSDVEMKYPDYIQAVANAFGLDCDWMREDVDSKSDDLGPDYDFETAYGILDLMEMDSDCVVIV